MTAPVRQAVAVATSSRRTMVERFSLRMPGLSSLVAALVDRLPPRSRLRQAVMASVVRSAFEAANRSDFDAAVVFCHPDIEVIEPPQLYELGLEPMRGTGLETRKQVQRRWQAEWGAFRIEPEYIVDLGDRLLVVSRMQGAGRASGAAFETDVANLFELAGGRPIREQIFLDRNEARAAAGLAG